MRPATPTLPPLEVAVRGRGAPLAGREHVRVHSEAHRAPGVAPFETRRLEDTVETFVLGQLLHDRRARDDHRPDARVDALACDNGRGGSQVLDPRVRARADEDAVERDV